MSRTIPRESDSPAVRKRALEPRPSGSSPLSGPLHRAASRFRHPGRSRVVPCGKYMPTISVVRALRWYLRPDVANDLVRGTVILQAAEEVEPPDRQATFQPFGNELSNPGRATLPRFLGCCIEPLRGFVVQVDRESCHWGKHTATIATPFSSVHSPSGWRTPVHTRRRSRGRGRGLRGAHYRVR